MFAGPAEIQKAIEALLLMHSMGLVGPFVLPFIWQFFIVIEYISPNLYNEPDPGLQQEARFSSLKLQHMNVRPAQNGGK